VESLSSTENCAVPPLHLPTPWLHDSCSTPAGCQPAGSWGIHSQLERDLPVSTGTLSGHTLPDLQTLALSMTEYTIATPHAAPVKQFTGSGGFNYLQFKQFKQQQLAQLFISRNESLPPSSLHKLHTLYICARNGPRVSRRQVGPGS